MRFTVYGPSEAELHLGMLKMNFEEFKSMGAFRVSIALNPVKPWK